jgi:hypothetical protein
MNYLNPSITNIKQFGQEKHQEYITASPFPSIYIDNFFNEDMLNKVVEEFPDLAKQIEIINFNNHNEKKLAAKGESLFGDTTKLLVHYLNSQPFLEFLQALTGIRETLMPDPYFFGGGYHEIKPGGLLKIHADFNKHATTKLDRRLNVLVYLNKDWDESYGGYFELWDKDMTKAHKKILPIFNRIAIFSTTDFSYHGHPDPLTCPPDRSRRSLALYYYSNGRPQSEINTGIEDHSTLFKSREGIKDDTIIIKQAAPKTTPPAIKWLKKMKKRVAKKIKRTFS